MAPPLKSGKQKLPALTGRLMVDTVNGKVRVRKWPRKRGPNVPEQVKIQNDRFRDAQKLAKLADPGLVNRLRDATKGSGLYPRDVLTKLMLAPPFDITAYDGHLITHGRREVFSIMFQGFRLALTGNQNTDGNDPFYPTWPVPVVDTAGFFNAAAPTYITIPDHVDGMIFFAGVEWSTVTGVDVLAYIQDIDTPANRYAMAGDLNSLPLSLSTGPMPVVAGERYALNLPTSSAKTIQGGRCFFAGIIISTDF